MVWLLALPLLVISEVVYLIRHPRTFNGLAAVVGLGICGIGGLFLYRGEPVWLVLVIWTVGVCAYYVIKLHP